MLAGDNFASIRARQPCIAIGKAIGGGVISYLADGKQHVVAAGSQLTDLAREGRHGTVVVYALP